MRPLESSSDLAGAVPGRGDDGQRVLFCSVGLVGTEVLLLSRVLETLR